MGGHQTRLTGRTSGMWLFFESRPECWLKINRYTICCYTRFIFCTKLALFFLLFKIEISTRWKITARLAFPADSPGGGRRPAVGLAQSWALPAVFAWQCCEEELTGTSWHTALWARRHTRNTRQHTGHTQPGGEGHLLLSRKIFSGRGVGDTAETNYYSLHQNINVLKLPVGV